MGDVDAQGRARIDGVELRARYDLILFESSRRIPLAWRQGVVLDRGDVDLELRPEDVEERTVVGRVVGSADRGIPGVTVRAARMDIDPELSMAATTDESGRFELIGVPGRGCAIVIESGGKRLVVQDWWQGGVGRTDIGSIVLR